MSNNYIPSIKFRRTPEERADQVLSWNREDKRFFAAGACHILAFAFIQLHQNEGYKIIYIKPKDFFSGHHLYVTNGLWAFDFNGWTLEEELLRITEEAYRNESPDWSYEKMIVDTSLEEFCLKNNHRLPEDFAFLPWGRAKKYIMTFAPSPNIQET